MAMSKEVDFLIIGAGPFGLSMASYAEHNNLDYLVLGKPMGFWKENMPEGMYLRSNCDWHIDPQGIFTIDKYLETKHLKREDVEPLSLDFYLSYSKWFQEQVSPRIEESMVTHLDFINDSERKFRATLDNNNKVNAKNVLLATGFKYFKNMPFELTSIIPRERYSHTCDLVDFTSYKGKKCLIIGGRQSAYEWAALLCESEALSVHISHRHKTPEFTTSDWKWVDSPLEDMINNPASHRNMPALKREKIDRRFWVEGRLKLEPWLWDRINNETITIWAESRVVDCKKIATGELEIKLDSGVTLIVDHIILATGYQVNMGNIPFIKKGNILSLLHTEEGYPVLDENLQTNIPGLFVTSMAATRDFGLFFAFTVSVNASAKIIGSAVMKSQT